MTDFFDGLALPELSALIGYAGGGLDRRSERRGPESVAEALADPAARFYLLSDDLVHLNQGEPLFTHDEAQAMGIATADIVLLGWLGDAPRLAALTGAASGDAPQTETIDLRTLAIEGTLAAEHLGGLALARSLTHWHARHGFCANCGAASEMRGGGFRRDCPQCNTMHFPRTDPVVIMVAIDGDRALLGRSSRFAPGMYSALAGFMEPGETIEEAVRRETLEEAGIRLGRIRYHASQPWPFPSSLMIGCHAEALTTDIVPDDDELEDVRWFPRAEVLTMLADDHPDGLKAPLPMAIAHHLIRSWAEAG